MPCKQSDLLLVLWEWCLGGLNWFWWYLDDHSKCSGSSVQLFKKTDCQNCSLSNNYSLLSHHCYNSLLKKIEIFWVFLFMCHLWVKLKKKNTPTTDEDHYFFRNNITIIVASMTERSLICIRLNYSLKPTITSTICYNYRIVWKHHVHCIYRNYSFKRCSSR